MTDTEIINGTCALKTRFNELLYELKGNSSDGIPNLSDINEAHGKDLGKEWDNSYNYQVGDICVLKGDIFIALTGGIDNKPDIYVETAWRLLNVKNLQTGRFYASAHCFIESSGSTGSNDFEEFYLSDSWNIDSLEYLGSPGVQEGHFKLNFSSNAGIVNSNYQVLTASSNKLHQGPVYNRYIFNTANVIFKGSTYLIFKIPYDRASMLASITIVPVQ